MMPDQSHPPKGPWVAELQEGQRFQGFYFARNPSLQPFRDPTRGQYLRFMLADQSGHIEARAWEKAEAFADIIRQAGVIKVEAVVESYRDQRQAIIHRMRAAETHEYELSDLRPATQRDVDQMMKRIDEAIQSVSNVHLQTLLTHFYQALDFRQAFMTAPAATRIHHAYIGGLLEHTFEVLLLAERLEELYPEIDHDLLTAGILLHDIGKLQEYRWDMDIEISDAGRLIGHLSMGLEQVSQAISSLPDFPPDLAYQLQHLILSHHGRYEYGSPRRPKTLEAIALHHIEFLDAQVNRFRNLIAEARANDQSWTTYDNKLGRSLYARHWDESHPDEQGLAD